MATSGRLIVAGDTPIGFGDMTRMLVEAGYRVRPAASGERVVACVDAREADLVLLDLSGLGTDGVDICRGLAERPAGHRVPVIVVGLRSDHDWRLAGLLAGAADIVEKPFHREELLACVRLQLGLRRLQVALEAKTKELRWASEALRRANSVLLEDVTHRVCAD